MKRERWKLYLISLACFGITGYFYFIDNSVFTLQVFFSFWSIIFLFILISHWYSIYRRNEILLLAYYIGESFDNHISGTDILDQSELVNLYVNAINTVEELYEFKEDVNFLSLENEVIDEIYNSLEDVADAIWNEIKLTVEKDFVNETGLNEIVTFVPKTYEEIEE